MNKKFLPGAVLFIIAFVLSSLAFPTHVNAQCNQVCSTSDTFYGAVAGGNGWARHLYNSGFGYYALSQISTGAENTAIGESALE